MPAFFDAARIVVPSGTSTEMLLIVSGHDGRSISVVSTQCLVHCLAASTRIASRGRGLRAD